MIEERSKTIERSGSGSRPRIRCVLSYCTLGDSSAQNFGKWIKKIEDVFEVDLVIVPYNVCQSHWALVVGNFRLKRFEYYDSLGTTLHEARRHIEVVKRMFTLEAASRKKPFDFSSNNYIATLQEIAEQKNGYDCGAFICTYADCLAQDLELDFTQANMPSFRLKMVRDIRVGELHYL
jgi:sentrin-specific protease 1